MVRTKTFKSNQDYFKFINNKKSDIKVVLVDVTRDRIKLKYDILKKN